MPGPFHFAWLEGPGPVPFDPVAHGVEDEEIVALTLSQSEGDFAGLTIQIKYPGTGLLAAPRMQWCWVSWDSGTGIVPLFHGRLVAFPEAVDGESVRLLFSAKPPHFDQVKRDYAETLKVLPYFDPVWITGDTEDPDTVLSGYGARWHIDRTTLALTHSDELTGEDGDIAIGEADHLYDAFTANYGDPPLSRIDVEGALTWKQTGSDLVDLTGRIYSLFRAHGSIYVHPRAGVISSLTGDGLRDDWPTTGTSLDGGWTVAEAYAIDAPASFKRYVQHVEYRQLEASADPAGDLTPPGDFRIALPWFDAWTDMQVDFPVWAVEQGTRLRWTADRDRAETLRCTVHADIQPFISPTSDDDNAGEIKISAADTVTEPDAGGHMAIGDTRRSSYLDTDRGNMSVQYLLLLARTELRRRARACEITCRVPWALGIPATLRKNVHITDRRLPGGEALGKIIGYTFEASGEGDFHADLTIGCAIGYGGTVVAAPGAPTYVALGYVDGGYQMMTGAEVTVPTDDLVYQSLDEFPIDDDGVDLFNINAVTGVQSLTLTGGLDEQIEVVTKVSNPVEALGQYPTRICLTMVPLAGQSFQTIFTPAVQPIPIPQRIDLEAA